MSTAPPDPGLQPERTELAWRRTALALAIGCLISIRLLPEALGDVIWALPGFLGLLASGGLWIAAQRRYRQMEGALGASTPMLPDGRTGFALAAIAFLAAVLGLGAVLVAGFIR
jgi:putative membrane protein